MSFEMALANMKRGEIVRRASNRDIAYRIEGSRFSIWQRVFAGGNEQWEYVCIDGLLHVVDILAEDWEVCE